MKAGLISVLWLLPIWLSATQIQWYCPPGLLNEDSQGQSMDSAFQFELGVFADGFLPSLENMDQWAEHWNPVQRARYHEEHHWFTAVYDVPESSPIPIGSQVYIWGFTGDPANGEWLLCSGQTWLWPSSNPRSPLPRIWNAAQADMVVLGDVADGIYGLRSATVTNAAPPVTTWSQWAAQVLGDANADPSEDANENGIQDGLEYVMGIDGMVQTTAGGLRIRMAGEGENKVVELLVPYRADRPALIDVEISFDLEQWFNANDLVNLHENKPLERIFRDNAGVAAMPGPWFWRYKVTPEE